MTKRARFRIGQHVQSAEDPTQTFVIRRSLVPERIYFGLNRWWTKNELQAIGASENPVTSLRLNGKAKCVKNACKCVQPSSEGLESADSFPTMACRGCGTVFTPKREWAQFCSTACRMEYWKRTRRAAAKESKALAAMPCDAVATVN